MLSRKPVVVFGICVLLVLRPLCAQITGELKSQPPTIHLSVDARATRQQEIPQTIFGTFLEPIRQAIYGGIWANLIENSSLEPGLWDAPHIAAMLRERPELGVSSQLDLPLPWEPLYRWQGNRYEPHRGDAANSDQSLLVMALPNGEVGIRQKVYLPARGELDYTGSLWAKHVSGADLIDISLRERNHPKNVLAHSIVRAASPEWTRYQFSLKLRGQVKPLTPVDFVVALTDNSRAMLDEISLMPADNVDGMDPEVLHLVRELHAPIIRFGGNFTSGYHFRDGLGPMDKRVSMRNLAWGLPEYNDFGTDEFLRFCQLVGAQPQIAVNMGSGTPREAAEWVRYVNAHWAGRNGGLLWELGNELWGQWTFGFPENAKAAAARTVGFSGAVRKVDPRAKLIATGGQDIDQFPDWNAEYLKTPPGTFNYLSVHWVASDGSVGMPVQTPDFMMLANLAQPVGIERGLRALAQQIEASDHKNVRIAFTEWLFNSSGDGEAGAEGVPDHTNMGGAIDAAGFLNMLMRVSDIVPIADMTGTVECAGVWKRQGRVFGTPTYYVMRMYSNEHPAHLIPVENDGPAYSVEHGIWRLPVIKDVPWLEVVAAETAGRDKLILFGVNRSLKYDLAAQIKVDGFQVAGSATVQALNSAALSDQNSAERPEKVVPRRSTIQTNEDFEYTFPHSSIVVIELDRAGR